MCIRSELDVVSNELAQKLKEIGFTRDCIYHYKLNSKIPTFEMKSPFGKNHNSLPTRYSAPFYSQVFKWFREQNYESHIERFGYYGYEFVINQKGYHSNEGYTYEEAQEQCVLKLIELKNKK